MIGDKNPYTFENKWPYNVLKRLVKTYKGLKRFIKGRVTLYDTVPDVRWPTNARLAR